MPSLSRQMAAAAAAPMERRNRRGRGALLDDLRSLIENGAEERVARSLSAGASEVDLVREFMVARTAAERANAQAAQRDHDGGESESSQSPEGQSAPSVVAIETNSPPAPPFALSDHENAIVHHLYWNYDKLTKKFTLRCPFCENSKDYLWYKDSGKADDPVKDFNYSNFTTHLRASHAKTPEFIVADVNKRVAWTPKMVVESRSSLSKARYRDLVEKLVAKASADRAKARRNKLTSYQAQPRRSGKERYIGAVQLAWMIATGQSFRAGGHPLHRAYLRAAGAAVGPVGDRQLRSESLSLLYDATMEYQLRQFHEATSFSVTFDIWTSRALKHALVSITYHWSHRFERHSAVFDAVPLHVSHTAANLAVRIAERIDRRAREDQVLYLGVTDNASNVTLAAQLLVTKFEELLRVAADGSGTNDDFVLDAEMFDTSGAGDADVKRAFRCVAHTINLAVGDMLSTSADGNLRVRRVIAKVQAVVRAVKRSHDRQRMIIGLQDEWRSLSGEGGVGEVVEVASHGGDRRQSSTGTKRKRSLTLVAAVPTRWNSTYDMLTRYLKLHRFVMVAMAQGAFDDCEDDDLEVINRDDIKVIEEVLTVLEPARDVSIWVQGDEYGTVGHILPAVAWMLRSLDACTAEDAAVDACRKLLRRSLARRFEPYFYGDHPAAIATAMHPHYAPAYVCVSRSAHRDLTKQALSEWLGFLAPRNHVSEDSDSHSHVHVQHDVRSDDDEGGQGDRDGDVAHVSEEERSDLTKSGEWAAVSALWTRLQAGARNHVGAAQGAVEAARDAEEEAGDAAVVRLRREHKDLTQAEEDAARRLAISVDRFLPLGALFDRFKTERWDEQVKEVFSTFSHGRFPQSAFVALAELVYGGVASSAASERVFSSSGRIDSP